ncbi:YceI-like domain-containing protein [Marinobacter daqiaonensis]|uniref:YceI-like domain-containing protein n=1 Tax=Marinobacter daqiaonensis TaxID=650891 RepID=A0A1I6GSB2_9GAMM|nr:cellulose binding domain-containing protein [Marinobacter daqiaonensis]SFR45125.1 YceI-like domain-containing protein [Marinobacter daqiaonensis]
MKTKSRLALLLCGSALSGTAAADSLCEVEYIIQHSWQTGAVHRVHLNYNGPATSGWNLRWTFPGQEQIDSIFNVTHLQNGHEVTVGNLQWNARLEPGSERKFGFNVRNPSGAMPGEFFLNGQRCGAETDPQEPEEPSEPGNPDEPLDPPGDDDGGHGDGGSTPPDSGNPGDGSDSPDDGDTGTDDGGMEPGTPAEPTDWSLNGEQSFLGFVTTKNINNVESHGFGGLAGGVSEDGIASLTIDLDSVQTGIDIRNQRLRQMLFNTAVNPTASVSIELGDNLSKVLGLDAGEVLSLALPARISLNGQTREIGSQLRIERLGNHRFLVSSVQPLIITADQFGLEGGVEALRDVAGLSSISIAVPVDFALFFETAKLPTP